MASGWLKKIFIATHLQVHLAGSDRGSVGKRVGLAVLGEDIGAQTTI
jgi:hypothetical protein